MGQIKLDKKIRAEILRIEQQYHGQLVKLHEEFAELAKWCEKPENRDAVKLMKGKEAMRKQIEDLALARDREIEEVYANRDSVTSKYPSSAA